MIYFVLFLIPFVFNPFGFQTFGLVKICFFLAVLGVALGWYGLRMLRGKGIEFRVNKTVLVFLFFWVLSFFLSVIFSLNPVQSLFGEYFYLQGGLFYLFVAVHFLICWRFFGEKGIVENFLKVVKWVGLGVALYAVVQYFFLNPEVVGRVYGTVGNPNFLAQFLIFPLFVVLFEKGKWQKRLFLSLILLAVFMTGSRAVMLGVLVSLYLWFLFYGRSEKVWKAGFSVILVVMLVGGLFLLNFDMRSVNSRLFLWSGFPDLVTIKYFVFGSGVESFYRRFAEIMPVGVFNYENFFTIPRNIHNEAAQIFVESGVFGTALYIIPVVYLVWNLFWKKFSDVKSQMIGFALLAYIISVQFSFSTVVHYVFLAAFWAVFLREFLRSDFRVKLKGVFVGVFTICISFAMLFSSVFLMRSDFLLKMGVDSYVADKGVAFDFFEKAADSSYVYAYPYELIVTFYGDDSALDRYGWITGYDFKYNVLAMETAFLKQRFDEVQFYYLKGLNDSPNFPLLYANMGFYYYSIGDCENAVNQFEILNSLAPNYEKGTEEYRLFVKHASLYEEAMRLLNLCRDGGVVD